MSTLYTTRDSVHLNKKGAKDGTGIRGGFIKSLVADAMDEATAASDALAAAEDRKRRKRKQTPTEVKEGETEEEEEEGRWWCQQEAQVILSGRGEGPGRGAN